MLFFEISKKLIYPNQREKLFLAVLIIFLVISGYLLVVKTGGTAYAYLHVLYIPVIFAGFIFSIQGGIIVGLTSGFLMSPFMPSIYAYELTQPFSSWALRMTVFTLIGALSGIGSSFFRKYIQELEIKHTTDPQTALPNLNGLLHVFSQLTLRSQTSLYVIVLDLNQMQEISAAIGDEGINTFIKQVAENLKEAVGQEGVLGRLQTHRFAILIPKEQHLKEVLLRCSALSDKTYNVNNIPIFAEMRFGIARYPYDDKDLNNLMRKALLSVSKDESQNQRINYFNKAVNDTSERNLLILHHLKSAIEEKSLVLEYQPKLYVKSQKVMGFESLVRWHDPLLGTINPMEFVPLTEGTLLINPFTKWVIETACYQMQKWNKAGILVPISLNFSTKNFQDPSLIDSLTDLLERYKIPPHFLEIEVTETAVASNIATIATALQNLREVGVRVAIDDFGTGQASQQYLLELPINVIKIDKVFVRAIAYNPSAAAIVKNAISLAHDLNLEVIAEGVETPHEYKLLTEWGCDAVQGYLIGKAMKENEATSWLKTMLKKGS